jgi:hypothetical protein
LPARAAKVAARSSGRGLLEPNDRGDARVGAPVPARSVGSLAEEAKTSGLS